jgi:far upstream element-binding protein
MFEMSVPGYKVGLIIGKGGETIKQIKERSGAQIIICQDSPEAAHEKPLRITGDPNAVETAKELIQEIINQKDDIYPQHQDGGMFEMSVPGYKVGLIMGKGGETIKRLKERSGAQLIIFQDSPEAAHEKPLRIIGDPNAVETAKELILEIINQKDDRDPQQQQGHGGRGGHGGYNDGYDDHDNSYGYHEPQAPPPVQHMVCFNL